MLPSFSNLSRILKCPASAALPQVRSTNDAAERGTAIHAYLADLTKMDRAAALARLADEYRPICEAIDHEKWPRELVAERAFAWDHAKDAARVLGDNIDRRYADFNLSSTEYPGTVDLLGISADAVHVYDTKTGRSAVEAPARNAQLRAGALAACRVYGKTKARVAIAFVREDGQVWWEHAELDAMDLDETAAQLHELAGHMAAVEALVASGKTPTVSTGDHCRYCPAKAACPAFGALLARAVTHPGDLEQEVRMYLTPENAAKAVDLWKHMKALTDTLGEAIFGFARDNPINLGNGLVLGETETQRREIDGDVAHKVLKDLHGPEVAEKAVERSASQASIERALRGLPGKITALKKDAIERIEAAGGLSVKVTRSIKEHKAIPA